ncbi:hypothetical protein [Marinobacter salsuginis]|jgi:hypothetical protein|uniref:Uncharacterized protein n=1 Tax=Marinobacter salsuginis TaxID=418719 RepID=A0A5M3Q5C2_9GAMM|nr:hypothetical protein [Marinobacter salsuginis]GBO90184.1 hypothetical protein MSSD14B_38520 [Marinobacter salsuginis]
MSLKRIFLTLTTAFTVALPFPVAASTPYDEWYSPVSHIAEYKRKSGEKLVITVQCNSPNTALWMVTHYLPKGENEGADRFLNTSGLVDLYKEGMIVRKHSFDGGRKFYDSEYMDASWSDWPIDRLVTKMWFQRKPTSRSAPALNVFLTELMDSKHLTLSFNRFLKDEILYETTFPLQNLDDIVFDKMYDHATACEYKG